MSKYLKDLERRRSKIIHIYRNGDSYSRARFIILRMFEQSDLDRIIRAVEEKVQLARNRPICKLFEMNGQVVSTSQQIEDGKYYVAGSAEPFFNVDYGHVPNWVCVGPVRTDKYANIQYISRREEEGTAPYSRLSASNSAIPHNNLSSKPKTASSSTAGTRPRNVKSLKNKKKEDNLLNKKMSASEHIDLGPTEPSELMPQNEEPAKEPDQPVTSPEPTNQPDENIQQNEQVEMEEKPTEPSPPEPHQQEEEQHEEQQKVQDEPSQEEVPEQQLTNEVETTPEQQVQQNNQDEEITTPNNNNYDNNVEDNEATMNDAAIKIQAGFRGYKVRSEMDKAQNDNKMQIDSLDEITEPNDNISQ